MNALSRRRLFHGRAGATMADAVVTVVVVMLCFLVVVGVMLPAIGRSRCGGSRFIKDGTQVRGIHQGLVLFAQGNRDQFPVPSEVDAANATIDPGEAGPESKNTTANVISLLVYNGFFSTELCVSPAEQNPNIVQFTGYAQSMPEKAAKPEQALWDPAFSADFTEGRTGHFSYAQAHFMGTRRAMWSNTFEASQAAIGNRGPLVKGLDSAREPILDNPASTTLLIHGGRKTWEGNIAYNDNHVNFETKMSPDSTPYATKSGKSEPDCLFFDEPDDVSGMDNLLTIITRNGATNEDLKTIWD